MENWYVWLLQRIFANYSSSHETHCIPQHNELHGCCFSALRGLNKFLLATLFVL